MHSAVKLRIVIPEDHRVELTLPEELPAGPAEVIVLSTPKPRGGHAAMGMDAGKGWIADDFNAPLPADLQRLFEGEP